MNEIKWVNCEATTLRLTSSVVEESSIMNWAIETSLESLSESVN